MQIGEQHMVIDCYQQALPTGTLDSRHERSYMWEDRSFGAVTCFVKAALYVATRNVLAFTLSIVEISLSGKTICGCMQRALFRCTVAICRQAACIHFVTNPGNAALGVIVAML